MLAMLDEAQPVALPRRRPRPAAAVLLGTLLAAALLALVLVPSNSKSQHEQAVEWIASFLTPAQRVQADSHLVRLAIDQAFFGPTTEVRQALGGTASQAEQDLDGLPDQFLRSSHLGAVGDAIRSLVPASARLRAALDQIMAYSADPATIDKDGMISSYQVAAQGWNAALAAIWQSAQRPLPPLVEIPS